MPVPSPSGKEKQANFVSRCMGDPRMVKEYDQKQRAAICYSQYKERHKHAKGSREPYWTEDTASEVLEQMGRTMEIDIVAKKVSGKEVSTAKVETKCDHCDDTL